MTSAWRPRSLSVVTMAIALALGAGCSLLNAPDDIILGSGGTGGEPSSGGAPASGGGGQGGGGCQTDDDCSELDGACVVGHCNEAHACEAAPRPAQTPCGGAPDGDCDEQDACDGAGHCQALLKPDGTYCGDCPAGPGSCDHCFAGVCGDCTTRALTKTFASQFAISGWKVNGSWGVHESTPPTSNFQDLTLLGTAGQPFLAPVFGTDGNREHPYPGAEIETSQADTPPFIVPASLNFYSWNADEGFQFDSKSVSISVDGGQTFDILAICPEDFSQPLPYAFCNSVSGRAVDAWDYIQIPVPAQYQGQVGIVRFTYFSQDYLVGSEQGWFIDRLEFATECACSGDDSCGYLENTCATATCDTVSLECKLVPQALGEACTADGEGVCSGADSCDAFGLCNPGWDALEAVACDTCPAGAGACAGCALGECLDCKPLQTFAHLQGMDSDDDLPAKGWTVGPDWHLTNHVPPNSTDASPQFFPDYSQYVLEHVLGTDGSRVESAPPGNEHSQGAVTTSQSLIPAELTFRSWHQDRGGQLGRDNKRVRVSIDGGSSWTVLADCSNTSLTPVPPFCADWTPMSGTNRAVTDWDEVSLTVPEELVGQIGIFELAYDTVDGGQGWERGWYIDDINVARCD